jgi:cyclohexadieny/prephenate dehydrogenase
MSLAHSKSQISTLAIIGLGLIGSSIARGVRERQLAKTIIAYDGSAEVRTIARRLDLAHSVVDTAKDCVCQADVIILCTPVGTFDSLMVDIAPHLKKNAILSDVGSVKKTVLQTVLPHLPSSCHFIPAHPVAGTEHSGPEAGFASLFDNRWCILTPPDRADQHAISIIEHLWLGLGSNVEIMSAEHHDLVLAITSHVPHLIAFNIVGTAADLEQVTQSEVIKFSAGGFRDFTRIAASDPTMWRDIFLNNKDAVLEMLGRFMEDLYALQRMIRWGDGDGLYELFNRTRSIRRSIIAQGQETSAPDFGRHNDKNQPT